MLSCIMRYLIIYPYLYSIAKDHNGYNAKIEVGLASLKSIYLLAGTTGLRFHEFHLFDFAIFQLPHNISGVRWAQIQSESLQYEFLIC